MKRITENKISTMLGLIFIILSIVLLFVPTILDVTTTHVGIIGVIGILLLFAKDKLINVLINKITGNGKE